MSEVLNEGIDPKDMQLFLRFVRRPGGLQFTAPDHELPTVFEVIGGKLVGSSGEGEPSVVLPARAFREWHASLAGLLKL